MQDLKASSPAVSCRVDVELTNGAVEKVGAMFLSAFGGFGDLYFFDNTYDTISIFQVNYQDIRKDRKKMYPGSDVKNTKESS